MAKGRPRKFDEDTALHKAMMVFWKKGYEGASLPDLTEAMGMNRPSLYSAFGNKEQLFIRVLDRYRRDPASYVNRALAMPTAAEVFAGLFYGVIGLVTDPENPGGCLFVNAALSCSDVSADVRRELIGRRLGGEAEIRARLERAAAEGDLSDDADPAALAKFAATVMWGLSVQSVNGSTREELVRVAELALRSLPLSGEARAE